jgi:hypothetical protein
VLRVRVLTACALSLLCGAPAALAAQWTTPAATLSAADVIPTGLAASIDGVGSPSVLWFGTVDGGTLQNPLRRLDGAWEDGPDASSGQVNQPAEVVVRPDGSSLGAWTETDGVHSAVRAPNGTEWTQLPVMATTSAGAPQLAVAPDGTATLAWGSLTNGQPGRAATLAPGGSAFGEPFAVNADTVAGNEATAMLDLAAGSDGSIVACWTESVMSGSITYAYYCRRRAGDGTFQDPEPIDTGSLMFPFICFTGIDSHAVARLRVIYDGAVAHVGWLKADYYAATNFPDCTNATQSYTLKYQRWSGGDWLATPTAVATEPRAGGWAAFAVDGLHHFVAMYSSTVSGPGANAHIDARVISADGMSGTDIGQVASKAGGSYASLEAATLASGRVLLAFVDDQEVKATFREAGPVEGFGPNLPISAAGQAISPSLGVAAGPGGDAIVSWMRSDGTNPRVQAVGYDDSGPGFAALSIPSSGAPGQDVAFSTTAGDGWSSPTTLAWNFGDGTSGTGTSPSHAYATAGTYTVTVTATDALGQTRSRSGSITIATPATPGGGGGGGGGTTDTTAPSISTLSLAPARFRVAAAPTALVAAKKRAPKGSKATVAVSEPSLVVMKLARLVRGAPRGGRCKAGAKPRKGQRRCTARVAAGQLSRAVAGSLTFAFTGRLGTKALKPGRYAMRATATDAAGNGSAAKSAAFRIVKR